LLINPTEADHQELYRSIETAFKRLQSEESHDSETDADIENITRLAQVILKREWQRVKRGT
jgi:triphosphoribosyl-dephospho-CoA synthetase